MNNTSAAEMADGVRQAPFLTMKFAVIGVDKAMREMLRDQLVKLSEWAEFRPCTTDAFDSLEMLAELPSIQNDLLCVVILDVASLVSCTSATAWLESLRKEQCANRVCVVVYNAHKVAQHAYHPDDILNLRMQEPHITFLFHGPDEGKWQSVVSSVLRWGEIAAGLRGNLTMQYLKSVFHSASSSTKINCVLIKK